MFRFSLAALTASFFLAFAAQSQPPASWAESIKLPSEEKSIKLFNGKDLQGWEGQIEKYWSVAGDSIKAANTTPVAASTYLFTTKNYRDFRLLLEIKQTRGKGFSTMHSAVACLGEKFTDKGDPFSYKGPLILLCDDWGYYEVNGRKRVAPAGQKGNFKHPAEKIGDWNQIEILVKGDRVRYACNGQLVTDVTEKPGVLKAAPIGLQLHNNKDKQEWHFRGLILSENPQDRLLTVSEKK
jgi:hypothetical protein